MIALNKINFVNHLTIFRERSASKPKIVKIYIIPIFVCKILTFEKWCIAETSQVINVLNIYNCVLKEH
jgi:hypothetical protein